ncbi:hypothetical protein GCM10010524_07040 [Streptomyces mexicanus]
MGAGRDTHRTEGESAEKHASSHGGAPFLRCFWIHVLDSSAFAGPATGPVFRLDRVADARALPGSFYAPDGQGPAARLPSHVARDRFPCAVKLRCPSGPGGRRG